MFPEKLRVWSQAFPPAPRDVPLQETFAPIGLGVTGPSPFADVTADMSTALRDGLRAGKANLDKLLSSGGSSPELNGWWLTLHVFDYNLDYFEIGALDEPASAAGHEGSHRRARGRGNGRPVGQPRV